MTSGTTTFDGSSSITGAGKFLAEGGSSTIIDSGATYNVTGLTELDGNNSTLTFDTTATLGSLNIQSNNNMILQGHGRCHGNRARDL